jgi:aminopeptidase N
MLADPESTSIESKQMVALVICHELSHQWFGNLVTMKWWDDLWLNESFANMMEYRAVDALYPEWDIWEQFVSHEGVSAKRRDSLADVQPIHTDVNHPDEISTLFDPSIVYAKGGTVLYMLLNYIGEEAFRQGLQEYFKLHAYGNTQADDLWSVLSKASGRNIGEFMHKWLSAPGYPLVRAGWKPGTKIMTLQQSRFLSDPESTTKDMTPWHIPLAATLTTEPTDFMTAQSSVEVTGQDDKPLLLNHDGTSYFLPFYTEAAHLQHIVNAIKRSDVSTIDRMLLLDNYNLLQRGGIADTTDLLDLLSRSSTSL